MLQSQMKSFAKAYSVIRAYANLNDSPSRALYADALIAIEELCNDNCPLVVQEDASKKLFSIIGSQSAIQDDRKYDVVIRSVPHDVGGKIRLIKTIREKTGLGLLESKNAVDKLPSIISGKSNYDALHMKAAFEAEGAAVDILLHMESRGRVYKILGEMQQQESKPTFVTTPNVFIENQKLHSLFHIGESPETAYERIIQKFSGAKAEKYCLALLELAEKRINALPSAHNFFNTQGIFFEAKLFKWNICGEKFDIYFSGIDKGRKDVVIRSCDRTQKIPLIRTLREIFGGEDHDRTDEHGRLTYEGILSLKDGKDIADKLPCHLKLGVSSYLADKIVSKLMSSSVVVSSIDAV